MKIELRRAAMTYQAPDGEVAALQDVTFGVADGEFVSIVGPSGCGKSTLLALIAGIEHPSGGRCSSMASLCAPRRARQGSCPSATSSLTGARSGAT